MPLVIENGTGLANADSYLSRADANLYFAGRGNPTAWLALTDVDDGGRDAALRYATRWVDGRYAWPGMVKSSTQSLAWPRVAIYITGSWAAGFFGLLDRDGRTLEWPIQVVKDAQCEAALAHASVALNAALRGGGAVQAATLGPMSVTFIDGHAKEADYPYIDALVGRIASPRIGSGVDLFRG